MKIRIPTLAGALLLAAALPVLAQERAAPAGPPPIERLEKLRLERLQESLGLTEEQTESLRRQLEENRAAMRESFERHHAAMESLHESLKGEPANQEALRRALADVEAARERMDELRDRQIADLGGTLTLEQRAKFLLFNRQFDSRLRELIERRRAPDSPGRQGQFRMRVVPPRDLDYGMPVVPPQPGYERPAPTREQRIEFLEKRIEEMQRQLEELRSGSGS